MVERAEGEERRSAAVLALARLIVAGDGYRSAAAAHFGLTVVDTHAISYLDTYGPMPQTELARRLDLTGGAVTGVVDRLERTQTARRVTDPDDRRRNRVELSDRAHEILAESRAGLVRVFDGLDDAQLDALTSVLPQIAEAMEVEAELLRR